MQKLTYKNKLGDVCTCFGQRLATFKKVMVFKGNGEKDDDELFIKKIQVISIETVKEFTKIIKK